MKPERPRVAVLSLHSSPLDQPGTGDSGGMNVYIRAVAERLSSQGVPVDVFTRCSGRGVPEVEEVAPGTRVIQIHAGPCAPVPKGRLPRLLPAFVGAMLRRERHERIGYDVVHSHYWLSGWVGRTAKEIWGVPLVASFHTLGRVKNGSLAPGEGPEPPARLAGEERVVRHADRILAPTPAEALHLVSLYRADPARIRIVPPGVDHSVFFPKDPGRARARFRLPAGRLVLFVGRLEPHKGPDMAIRAFAEAAARDAGATSDVSLVVVGGSPGERFDAKRGRLLRLAAALGLAGRVTFLPAQPQDRLAELYSAAEVVVVPSRSESFGLVALEAQACGTPVVAAAAGGLPHVVADGSTGFLVRGGEPGKYADRILRILSDPRRSRRMGEAGVVRALGFSWDATTAGILAVYGELITAPSTSGGGLAP